MEFYKALLCLFIVCPHINGGSRILVAPWVIFFNSRIMSILKLAEDMAEDGHQVTVLLPTFLENFVQSKSISVISFKMDEAPDTGLSMAPEDLKTSMDTGYIYGLYSVATSLSKGELELCDKFYQDRKTLQILKQGRFDLLFADHFNMFTRAVIDFMDIPTLLYAPDAAICYSDILYPTFPSFVCPSYRSYCGELEMTFWTRLQNFIAQVGTDYYLTPAMVGPLDELRKIRDINSTVSASDSFRKHVIVANIDYVMEPLRPKMPHVIPIAGLIVRDPKPIQNPQMKAHLDEAEKGAIIMSLGTFMTQLNRKSEETIATTLSNLQLNVIWKHSGEGFENLGKNVLLSNWIPQNDLLGHKNTKLFITHGGTHSMYEAAHRGVPVLCMPFFIDQHVHCNTMAKKLQMGIVLDIDETPFNEASFREAINEVLTNPLYSKKAKHIKFMLEDQPMTGKEKFLYWVNYTIRHNGATHLVADAPFKLNIIQYLSLDVVAFLLSIPLLAILIFAIIIKWICAMINKVGKDPMSKKSKKKTR